MTSRSGPAYARIAAEIIARIEANALSPGDRLPAERDLAEEFGVARMTVRQALDQLQMDGVIGRKRGRSGGSFVLGNRPVVELTHRRGILPQLDARGHAVMTEVLTVEEFNAPATLAAKLRVPFREPVVRIVRVHHAADTPVLISDSHFPAHLVPGIASMDLNGSLAELLDRHWSLAPARKEETLAPGVATPFEQEHLGVSTAMPLLRIQRVTELQNHRVLEYSEDVLRSDAASVRVSTAFSN